MSPEETASAAKDLIALLGGGFMLSDEAKVMGKETGAGGWGTYFIGRGGVLGDVDADVVACAVGFFPPEIVRKGWDRGRAVLTPAEGAARYAQVCHEWGRKHLAAAPDLDELAELLTIAVAAPPPVAVPLFAGWRAMPLPDDAPARVAQLSHVLREHRGGVHLLAVTAAGLTAQQAVLTGGGTGSAQFFQWPEPYEDVTHLAQERELAEEATNGLAALAWGALDDAQADRVIALLTSAADAAKASLTG